MDNKKIVFGTVIFLLSLISVVSALETENSFSGSNVIFQSNASEANVVPVYRFWSPSEMSHFYTISESERDNLIENYPLEVWTYEGIAFYAYSAQEAGTLPVYRFWSPSSATHFYTIDEAEKNYLMETYPEEIWTYETIAFYAYNTQVENTLPVYRFWSPVSNGHFYTISESERNKLIENYSDVWTPEAIAFYVFPDNQSHNGGNETPSEELQVTNLRSIDRTASSITWRWSNPSEEFDQIAIYLDGENVANLSNTITSYKATGLEDNTVYTISIRIIDDGKISSLNVYDSERTLKEGSSGSSRARYVVSPTENDDFPVVFTSGNDNQGTINLNGNSASADSSEGFFEKITPIHYVLVAVAILCLIALALIFKNI